MKRKHIYWTALIFLSVLTSCATVSQFEPGLETPPNGVLIEDNLYLDQSEITNFNWLEYMYWTKRIFGRSSTEYQAILPDTNVWNAFDTCITPYIEYYLRHPAYRDYPVVGISQEQAVDFSNWRSDRVFEFILIREEIMDYNPNQTKEMYFTIERYFAGEYLGIVPNKWLIQYPHFRLPTKEERKIAIAYSDSVNNAYFEKCRSKDCKACSQKMPYMHSDEDPCDMDSGNATFPVNSGCFAFTENSIHNLRGNAAEWVSEKDFAAGGGWTDKRSEILQNDVIRCLGVNAWTGFRNVCEWRSAKVKYILQER